MILLMNSGDLWRAFFFFFSKIQGWTPRDRTMHVVRITIRKTGQSPRTEWSGNWLQDMGVSVKRGTPQIIPFNRVFHYKPSILGYPYFWKQPYVLSQKKNVASKKLFFLFRLMIPNLQSEKTFSSTSWRIIPVSKWLITMAIVSPLTVVPLPNGLNGL